MKYIIYVLLFSIILSAQIGVTVGGGGPTTQGEAVGSQTATYYFDGYDEGEAWSDTPENFCDGSTETYTGWESNDNRVQYFDENTCDGTDLGTIDKIEIRVFGKISGGANGFNLRAVFPGGDGDEHNLGSISFSGDWSSYIDVTNDTNHPTWSWANVVALDAEVRVHVAGGSNAGAKVEVRVTYH
jgi:hypothetical protein